MAVVELGHGDEGGHCAEACAGNIVGKHDHIDKGHNEYSFPKVGHNHHSQKEEEEEGLEEDGSHGRSVEEVDGGDGDETKMNGGHGDDATKEEGETQDPESAPGAVARMAHQRI